MKTHSNKPNTILWLSLLILMVANYWFAEESGIYHYAVITIVLAATVIKFIGIGFIYMELKKAHISWKIMLVFFILFFAIIVRVISY